MAQLTPEEILELSEPVEKVYSDTVDALLLNIAKHFSGGRALSTAQWDLQKLAELGQLTQESIAIIAQLTGQVPSMIELALESAAHKALKDIEPELAAAAKAGKIKKAAETVQASKSITYALKSYAAQAVSKANLVNTTMLQSTLQLFRRVVSNTISIERQLQAVQETLNTETGRVITGTVSRQSALRQALARIHKEGITGFYDRAGRKWSPEAYVNMDIRTTVHNTAIEAVRLRQQDYGVHIFRVSRHGGARPLCYPHQGKYYSWDGKSGTFEDGEGIKHRYAPVSSTSYGKPAGLFGVNCGHHPITVIPGVSIPRDRSAQNSADNDRVYAISQEQRRLERDIRRAKQKAAMLDAAGDKEGFEQAALGVKTKQQRYNAFCAEIGRTKRLDRTQVFDYNKSIAGKAKSAARKYEISIGRSLGAKSKNYDILEPNTGEYFHFVEGSKVQDTQVFAGKGSKRRLHPGVAEGLSEQLGGKSENWQHVKGHGIIDYYGEDRPAEVHWFQEESVGKVKFKVKRWEDED